VVAIGVGDFNWHKERHRLVIGSIQALALRYPQILLLAKNIELCYKLSTRLLKTKNQHVTSQRTNKKINKEGCAIEGGKEN